MNCKHSSLRDLCVLCVSAVKIIVRAREPQRRRVRRGYAEKLVLVFGISIVFGSSAPTTAQARSNDYLFNDTHFHLTNYIQEGIDIRDFLTTMGDKAGRVAIFGIPLQQQWSYRVD